jgi:hypothetical protein
MSRLPEEPALHRPTGSAWGSSPQEAAHACSYASTACLHGMVLNYAQGYLYELELLQINKNTFVRNYICVTLI